MSAHVWLPCRFYEFAISGRQPPWSRATKPRGGWRMNSHMYDGFGPDTINMDLSGGYYDAGDHLKLVFPLGFSLAQMSLGPLTFK